MPLASGVMKNTQTSAGMLDRFLRPLRTLVVDDSVVLLKGLCAYIKTQPLFQVVGTAVDGGEALYMAELLGPDLILMDLRMPVVDGLQATAILRRRVPNIRIIIMTMEDSATAEAEARAHGAHGFIWKPRIMDGLITEVRRAFRSNHTKDEAEQLLIPSRSGASTGLGAEPCSRRHPLQSDGHRTERSLNHAELTRRRCWGAKRRKTVSKNN